MSSAISRWSRGRAAVEAIALVATLGVIGESVSWAMARGAPFAAVVERWAYILGAKPPLPPLVEIPSGVLPNGERNGELFETRASGDVRSILFLLAQRRSRFASGMPASPMAAVATTGLPIRAGAADTRPVINVSWQDAQTYVAWLSQRTGKTCRLPSEAEWEYAARAGTTTEYALPAPYGSDDITGKALANCADCGSQWDLKQIAPVGNFPANAWGLHDMHGNVFEWVEDCSHDNYAHAPDDGRAWLEENGGDWSLRVLRGGSWDGYRDFARSAVRVGSNPFVRFYYIGFRVVCSSPIFGH